MYNTIYQINYKNNAIELKNFFEIDFDIVKMNLTEDKLFLFGYNWYYNPHLLVYDITNVNNFELIGNSTIDSSMNGIFMDEKRVYIITEEGNLALYEVMENNQLNFIFEFDFNDLRSVYSNNSHIYTCDKDGLKIYEINEDKYLKFINHFAIENAKSLFVKENIIYLTTTKTLLTLDQTNIENILELDKHYMNSRINLEYKRVTVYNNRCIILNEFSYSQHEIVTYSGSLFVFDVSNPEKIVRLFPDKIPFHLGFGATYLFAGVILISPIFIIVGIFWIVLKVKKRRMKNNTQK